MRMRRGVFSSAGGGWRGRRRRSFAEDGQADDEFRAVAEAFAAGFDAAAVQFHKALHEREADPQAAVLAVQRAAGLHEKIEDMRQQFGLDARAVVAHGDGDFWRLSAIGAFGAERDVDSRRRCICRRC